MPEFRYTIRNILYKFLNKNLDKDSYDVIEDGKTLEKYGADELSDAGFWISSKKNDSIFYSTKMRKSLGYEDENDFPNIENSYLKIVNKLSLEKAKESFNYAIENNKKEYSYSIIYTKKDGNLAKFLCSSAIIKDNKGQLDIIIGTLDLLQTMKI